MGAAPPPSAAAMMYSYASPADAVPYNPLVKSPTCFATPDRSTSGFPPVYGDDVTNRMYFSSSVTSSITSLADAYLMQATLPHLHHHNQQQQQGLVQNVPYNSLIGTSNSKAAEPGQFAGIQAGGGGTAGVNGHLQLSQQPLMLSQPGLVDSSPGGHHQFLPSITEFGAVARHGYC